VHLQTTWSAERNHVARREQNNACQTTEIIFLVPTHAAADCIEARRLRRMTLSSELHDQITC